MNYTIIKKFQFKDREIGEPTIGVAEGTITFHKGFCHKYGIDQYVMFAVDEEHNLCFRFLASNAPDAFKITVNRNRTPLIRLPRLIQYLKPSKGKYSVTLNDDGWFVTSCKIDLSGK